MRALRNLLAVLALASTASLEAGPDPMPSDVAISLSAEPHVDLHPGDVVSFSLSITNNGPEPVERVAVSSSPIYDELDVFGTTADCPYYLLLTVTDLEDGFYYSYLWAVLLPDTPPPLEVGETRYCYFSVPYTSWAPPEFQVTFSTAAFPDINPGNNTASVTLYRARGAAQAAPVPALLPTALFFLIALMALFGAGTIRRTLS